MIIRTANGALFLACSLASIAYAEEISDPEQIFQQAMELRNSGEIYPAIDLLQSVLDQQPGLHRARLELAVAYHRARQFAQARELLTQVYNDPATPEAVKLSINAYLAQLGSDEMATQKGTSTSIYVSAGLFTDSNVNLGPSPELANVTATETDGTGMTAMASVSHLSRAQQPLDINDRPVDFEWRTQATAYSKVYSGDESDFNVHVLSFYTGPALVDHNNWRGALNFRLEKMYFDDNPYSFNVGINPNFTLVFTNDIEVNFELLSVVREHADPSNEGLDGAANSYSVSATQFYSELSIGLEAGAKYHDNGADASHLHAQGAEIYLSGQIPAWEDARLYAQLSQRDYDYRAADPATTNPSRDETETQAVLGVSHTFNSGILKSWTLNSQVSYTENDSNLAIFEYDRTLFEINMRSYF